MGRKSKTQRLIEAGLGEHLALPVAAHLARSQLVPDPLKVHDAQHLSRTLDLVARALARVAPLHIHDEDGGALRELTAAEISAGGALPKATIKRSDLRQAIAILKSVGIPEVSAPPARQVKPAGPPEPDLLMHCAELERRLESKEPREVNALAVRLARCAPDGRIANLAMQLASAVNDGRETDPLLARLRSVVEEVAARAGRASS